MNEAENTMDTSPDSEADTASGGPAERPENSHEAVGDRTGDPGAPRDPAATDDDGAPVDNPAG